MAQLDGSRHTPEITVKRLEELGEAVGQMIPILEHEYQIGPPKIQKSLDAASHSSPETKKATDALIDPFLHPGHAIDMLLGKADDPKQRLAQFQTALDYLSKHPGQADEITKSFNDVMNQYGVSLKKDGDNLVLSGERNGEESSVTFDKAGKLVSSEDTTRSEILGDLTLGDWNPAGAADEFSNIQDVALHTATDLSDKRAKGN